MAMLGLSHLAYFCCLEEVRKGNWPIPCHLCHIAGNLYLLLKQCKIPFLIFNLAKYPPDFVQDLFKLFALPF